MEHLQQKSLSYPELASFCGEMGMIPVSYTHLLVFVMVYLLPDVLYVTVYVVPLMVVVPSGAIILYL